MTKQGYKNKFIKTFTILTIAVGLLFVITSNNLAMEAILGQFLFAGMYMFIPSIIVAGIWEFFNNKGEVSNHETKLKAGEKI